MREATAFATQSITQFTLNGAAEQAAEVLEQHRGVILNDASWARVMDALSHPPTPNEKLKRAAQRLQDME
ncbi:toxin-antitoxin system, antitoxin component [Salmonella enterica subsp. enterica]|nr:toxin-antitoxin system, antitoxin component [Salmonella enterica subsp. enterica]